MLSYSRSLGRVYLTPCFQPHIEITNDNLVVVFLVCLINTKISFADYLFVIYVSPLRQDETYLNLPDTLSAGASKFEDHHRCAASRSSAVHSCDMFLCLTKTIILNSC